MRSGATVSQASSRFTCKTRKELGIGGSAFSDKIFHRNLSRSVEISSPQLPDAQTKPQVRVTRSVSSLTPAQLLRGAVKEFSASSAKEHRALQVAFHTSGFDFQIQL